MRPVELDYFEFEEALKAIIISSRLQLANKAPEDWPVNHSKEEYEELDELANRMLALILQPKFTEEVANEIEERVAEYTK